MKFFLVLFCTPAEEVAAFTMKLPSKQTKEVPQREGDEAGQGDNHHNAAQVKELQRQLKKQELTAATLTAERDALKKELSEMDKKWKIHKDTLGDLTATQKKVAELENQVKTYTVQFVEAKDKETKLLGEHKQMRRTIEEKDGEIRKTNEKAESARRLSVGSNS